MLPSSNAMCTTPVKNTSLRYVLAQLIKKFGSSMSQKANVMLERHQVNKNENRTYNLTLNSTTKLASYPAMFLCLSLNQDFYKQMTSYVGLNLT